MTTINETQTADSNNEVNDTDTLFERFLQIAEKFPSNDALVVFESDEDRVTTYEQLKHQVQSLISGLRKRGLKPKDKIAIMLKNGPQWVCVDLASMAIGVVTIPIHTTYGADYVNYIIEDARPKWLVIDYSCYDKIKQNLDTQSLEHIVFCNTKGVSVPSSEKTILFDELFLSNGDATRESVNPNDTQTIVYTSGTTGNPKGVELTHANISDNTEYTKKKVPVHETDRFFSFLPLSHMLERTAGYYIPITSGATIYYARSKDTFLDDLKRAKPTVIVSVPRVFEKIYKKIFDSVAKKPRFKQKIFFTTLKLARKQKNRELMFFEKTIYPVLRRLITKPIQNIFGGHIRLAVSGGASLNKKIHKFFDLVDIPIIEGYGLTETSPIVSVNRIGSSRPGTVGTPIENCEIKISDQKEIFVRGTSVMKGYYKREDETRLSIDENGWFHTGDLGFVDKDGFLTIIGRKKEMIVLSTGRNVMPAPIEHVLSDDAYISQAMVYGDNHKCLSSVIVPEPDALLSWCETNNINCSEITEDVLMDSRVQKLYETRIKNALKDFPPYQQVSKFKLISEGFSQENDTLTPTLKLKRNNIIERYCE